MLSCAPLAYLVLGDAASGTGARLGHGRSGRLPWGGHSVEEAALGDELLREQLGARQELSGGHALGSKPSGSGLVQARGSGTQIRPARSLEKH